MSVAGGLLIPVLPLFAARMTDSYVLIGVALAAQALGTLVADVPAGRLLRRLGHRRIMVLGIGLVGVSTAALALIGSVVALVLLQLLAGVGGAMWNVSRHAYMADMTRRGRRGRAISLFGGTNRVGRFVGPAVGGVIAGVFGLRAPFLIFGVLAMVALLFSWRYVEEGESGGMIGPRPSLRRVLAAQRQVFLNAGAAQLMAQAMRAGRQVLIPLYGAEVLGLAVEAVGLIVSVAAFVDLALVLPAGWVMDRFGRKYAIVPSFFVQGVGMALVSFAGGFTGLLIAASLIGLGNGLGSGTMMTLGADLAPEGAVGEFLGAWRLIGDSGASSGPLLVGVVADLLGLTLAPLVVAAVGGLAALTFATRVPETLRRT